MPKPPNDDIPLGCSPELGSIKFVTAASSSEALRQFNGVYHARTNHSRRGHSAGVLCSRRLGSNWRRKRHQRWCSSKVRVRRNRAGGDWGRGRDVEVDDDQKEKEAQKAPVRHDWLFGARLSRWLNRLVADDNTQASACSTGSIAHGRGPEGHGDSEALALQLSHFGVRPLRFATPKNI